MGRRLRLDRRERHGRSGVAAWQALKTAITSQALAPLGSSASSFGVGTSNEHEFDISDGTAYAFRRSTPAQWRAAAATAFDALAAKFGSGDPAAWREPRRMYEMAAQGAGQPPPMPFFDRGTWEQILELGP